MGEYEKPFKQELVFDEQRNLYDYWRSKCRPGILPNRNDVHPRDIIRYLPFITLTDVIGDEIRPDFRVRLAGTGLRTVLDKEITGHRLSELPFGNALPLWRNVHERIVSERKPLCGATPFIWAGCAPNKVAALAQYWVKFPLADKNGTVSSIFAYDIFMPLADLSPELNLQFNTNRP